jgi:hypothetical protein
MIHGRSDCQRLSARAHPDDWESGTSILRSALRRSDYSPEYTAQMSGVVALVGRLMDIAAILTQLSFEFSATDQKQVPNLAAIVARIRTDLINRQIPGGSRSCVCFS